MEQQWIEVDSVGELDGFDHFMSQNMNLSINEEDFNEALNNEALNNNAMSTRYGTEWEGLGDSTLLEMELPSMPLAIKKRINIISVESLPPINVLQTSFLQASITHPTVTIGQQESFNNSFISFVNNQLVPPPVPEPYTRYIPSPDMFLDSENEEVSFEPDFIEDQQDNSVHNAILEESIIDEVKMMIHGDLNFDEEIVVVYDSDEEDFFIQPYF